MESFPEYDPSIASEFGDGASQLTWLGVPVFEADSMIHLLIRFAFNFLVSWIIIQFFYYKKSHRRDYYVTFMLFSSVMFLLIFLMENVKLQIGLTLGLFAIFGVIRYRTETVPIREMTYLFVIIGSSVINGLALNISYAELVVANLLLIIVIWILESQKVLKQQSTKLVLYDRIEMIVPEKREELKADLEKRLGVDIEKVEVGHVDFLKDVAFVKVYYNLGKGESNSIDHVTKINQYND